MFIIEATENRKKSIQVFINSKITDLDTTSLLRIAREDDVHSYKYHSIIIGMHVHTRTSPLAMCSNEVVLFIIPSLPVFQHSFV